MSFKTVVLPQAKSDIQSATDWYENQQQGLGKKFKQQIIKAIDAIGDPVRGYGFVYINLSRVFVEKFPYCIYFIMDEVKQTVVIYAVLHGKQNRNSTLEQRAQP